MPRVRRFIPIDSALHIMCRGNNKQNIFKIIQLGYEPVRVDILTSIEGCSFEEVWKNKKTFRYGEQKAFFMGRAQLIKNKRASSRKQDKLDLQVLLKTASPYQ